MNISDLNREIMFGNWTNDQLNSITAAIKYARNQLGRETKLKLTVGAQVKWRNTRTGWTEQGKVQKINRKFVIVDTGTTRWRVPANMLEQA